MISIRTRNALQALKASGKQLGQEGETISKKMLIKQGKNSPIIMQTK